MGKGFDTFIENPYWRKIYEEAPGEYLKEHAGIAQTKIYYQMCIDKLIESGKEDLYISAASLKCEVRNPWYNK